MRYINRNGIFLIRGIIVLLAAGVSLSPFQLQAQMMIVGSPEEDSLRMAQLRVSDKPLVSMAVRPVELRPAVISWKKAQVVALPFTLITQYNSHHPFGWNDGSMIPAKGVQTFVRAGVYMRVKNRGHCCSLIGKTEFLAPTINSGWKPPWIRPLT